MQAEIVQDFIFEAAHFLPAVAEGHRCHRLHGHTYLVNLHVQSEIHPDTGWVMDFQEIEAVFEPLRQQVDHRLLNDVPGLENPTAEVIAAWIWVRLKPVLPALFQVVVHENPHSRAIVRG